MENNFLEDIYKSFDKCVNWNALLYITQKTLSTIFTFILFNKLSTYEFSIWININSIVFLIILWIDLGFRKSVPKFIPLFSKNRKQHISFINLIITCQLVALFLVILFFIFKINFFNSWMYLKIEKDFINILLVVLFFESIVSLLNLIYHSHFWNKLFSLIYSSFILIEIIICLLLLFFKGTISIINILLIKIVIKFFIIILSVFFLIRIYKINKYLYDELIDYRSERNHFFTHSFLMWFNTSIRSLSERNFLVPFFTFSIGAEFANSFKIANDWAILFQRLILKTIGTNDILLLSYVDIFNKSFIQNAFKKVFSKIIILYVPLIFFFIFLLINKKYFFSNNSIIFNSFVLLVIFYLVESILLPFERLIEINKEYFILSCSYIFLLFFICFLLSSSITNFFGLKLSIFSLFFAKLANSIFFALYAYKKYNLSLFNKRHFYKKQLSLLLKKLGF